MASAVHDVGIDHVAISDSVPVGAPQRASTPQNIYSWFRTSECNRYGQYNCRRQILNSEIEPGRAIFGPRAGHKLVGQRLKWIGSSKERLSIFEESLLSGDNWDSEFMHEIEDELVAQRASLQEAE